MPRAAMDTSEGFLERAFRFNVTAAFTLTKLAARQMVDTGGTRCRRQHLVALGQHDPDQLRGLRRGQGRSRPDDPNFAPELAPRVRVNAIDVGGVATRSLDIVLTDDTLRRQYLAGTPMGRPGEPDDIACAVLYLVSDASSWVTGKVFEIDGGAENPAISVPAPPLTPVARPTEAHHLRPYQ